MDDANRSAGIRLPAEWEDQDGVLLVWPSHRDIWEPELPLHAVQAVHLKMIRHVVRFQRAVVLAERAEPVACALAEADIETERVTILEIPTNDLWIRDFGPLTLVGRDGCELRDFTYNGWGGKYPADLDNAATGCLLRAGLFGACACLSPPMVLEGGSIDTDGCGAFLTTTACLLAPTRNPELSREQVETALGCWLGAKEVIWLENGWLEGDDTDGHVDMLARFAPGGVILHTTCDDPDDPHHAPLSKLAAELAGLDRYDLRPLPIPRPMHAADGHRLPASYANFLVVNQAVLVPIYGDPEADSRALTTIATAFPGREIVGIDACPLIQQHGSLHCASMQAPRGVLVLD